MISNSLKRSEQSINYKENNSARFKIFFWLIIISHMFVLGIYVWLDVLVFFSLLIIFLLKYKSKEFLLLFFVLVIFENQLELPLVEISFFRIYQLMFLIRIFNSPHEYLIRFKDNAQLLLLAIFFIFTAALYITEFEHYISIIINLFIIQYIYTYNSKEQLFGEILAVISISALFSGLFGLLNGYYEDYGYALRYWGVIGDPNYSSYINTIGFFSTSGTDLFDKKTKIVIQALLLSLIISTVSLTGFFGIIFLIVIYEFLKKSLKAIHFSIILIASLIVFLSVRFFVYGNTLYGLQYRLLSLLAYGIAEDVTSYRFFIIERYLKLFAEQPLLNQLIGGTNSVTGGFRDEAVSMIGHISHNSYIDILFMIGLIGLLVYSMLIAWKLLDNINKYKSSGNSFYLTVVMITLTVSFYMLTINIFPYRFYFIFMMMFYVPNQLNKDRIKHKQGALNDA